MELLSWVQGDSKGNVVLPMRVVMDGKHLVRTLAWVVEGPAGPLSRLWEARYSMPC